MSKPILVLDFDGVLHSYTSGWVEAYFIPDPPVPGAMQFLYDATKQFDVKIFSSRSKTIDGLNAMNTYIRYWAVKELDNHDPDYKANAVITHFCYNKEAWPVDKPPAFLTIDDRAIQFTGVWPDLEELRKFKPWNK